MCKLEFEKSIPANDGTRCFGCGQCYEIMLLVPSESRGGNRRRFARHYRCDCCSQVFTKYDFAFLFQVSWNFMFGRFTTTISSAIRPTGRIKRQRLANELFEVEHAAGHEEVRPVTTWVKKSQFRSRKIAKSRPNFEWTQVVNRDFIRTETLMPMHIA